MPETAPQEQFSQDLGLGGKLSERSRVRLVNHAGTFNVRPNDLSPFHPYDAITRCSRTVAGSTPSASATSDVVSSSRSRSTNALR